MFYFYLDLGAIYFLLTIQTTHYFIKKSFFLSFLIVFITLINDITLYDFEVNMFMSILLAGLKTILDEKSNKILK